MRNILLSVLISLTTIVTGQKLNTSFWNEINLDTPGLEQVKALHGQGKMQDATTALLQYYRARTNIVHPEIDLTKIKISKDEQKYADEALEHKFFSHKGYQPSYFYGTDINWRYWPVQDNELRWQLHRHKWFVPMGKAYRLSGDEKYAKEWTLEYLDWIVKNPYTPPTSTRRGIPDNDTQVDIVAADNVANFRYAWRPLEVSHRLQDQTIQFLLFNTSPYFTPEFFSQFMANYYLHAKHIMGNFSESGNHLLFEAQRILCAGVFFPEFKEAPLWRKTGINILNTQMAEQIYADGVQFELCPHYHLATIEIFIKAAEMANLNGYQKEFPASYYETIEKMIVAEYNLMFPDYTNPLFSDAKQNNAATMVRSFAKWSKLFPKNEQFLYFAAKGEKGEKPTNNSRGFENSGFFVFRNGWEPTSTAMIVKAGPPAFWHNQPDNGTFELYIKGRNFFPDAGAYVYAGDAEVMKWRNWFRQTSVHKTLTLNNKDIETTDSKTLLWQPNQPTEILVTENQSYKELKHRRSIFYVNQRFFVIVDEAVGDAKGDVAVHYQFAEGNVKLTPKTNVLYTTYSDANNVVVKTMSNQSMSINKEEGWVSYDYRQKAERPAYAITVDKKTPDAVRYITVILPVADPVKAPTIKSSFVTPAFNEKELNIKVKIGNESYNLNYTL